MWTLICTILLLITGFLLMFIILLQRGRGGGLAGAFGGLGGQSAFGTKAGDIFTKITIVMAICWVVLAGVTGFAMRAERSSDFLDENDGKTGIVSPDGKTADPKKKSPTAKKSPKTKAATKTNKTEQKSKTGA